MCEVPDNEVPLIKALREKYLVFGVLVMAFTPYSAFMRKSGFPKLPLCENWPKIDSAESFIPKEILEATGYREFLQESLSFGKQGIREFKEIRERNDL